MAVMNLTMRSLAVMRDVKVTIIFPEDRRKTVADEPGKKYKSLYILHGGAEDNSTWVNSSTIYLNTRDLDLFVICVSGYNSMWIDTKFGWKMEEFLTKELIVKMQNMFPISDKREDRYIMGESMGGFGTWHTVLKHPDLYSKAVPLSSGSMALGARGRLMDISEAAGSEERDPEYLRNLARKMNESDLKSEFFMMCGTEDGGYERCLETEKFLREECPNIPLKAEYWSGKHDFYFWNEAIPKALAFLGFKSDPERIRQI